MEYNSDTINESVTGGDQSSIKGNPNIVSASRISAGAGVNKFEVSQDGVWVGAENFTNAPFSVDFSGNMKSNGGTFGGTLLIGSSNNSQIQIVSNAEAGQIVFLYNSSQQGNIIALDNGTVSFFTVNDLYFGTTQGQCLRLLNSTDGTFVAGSVQLRTSGSSLGWSSGRRIYDGASYLGVDGDFICSGNAGAAGVRSNVAFKSHSSVNTFSIEIRGGIITEFTKLT